MLTIWIIYPDKPQRLANVLAWALYVLMDAEVAIAAG